MLLSFIIAHNISVRGEDLQLKATRLVHDGFIELEQKRYDRATQKFEQALALQANNAEFQSYVGLAQFKDKEYEAAFEAFERARIIDANIIDPAFLFYKASSLRSLGLLNEERKIWTHLIRQDPESRFADLGRKALEDGREPNDSPPENIIAIGNKHWDAKPYLTLAYYREALSRKKKDQCGVLMTLASSLIAQKNYAIILLMDHEYQVETKCHSSWKLQVGIAQMSLENWNKALNIFSAIPQDAEMRENADYFRAVCYTRLGKNDKAHKILTKLTVSDNQQLQENVLKLLNSFDTTPNN